MRGARARVVVVGGGAAGMMAAIAAAGEGASVLLLEKTAQLGFKIAISGGGRCNLTNAESDVRALVSMYGGNGRFLQGALRAFTKDDLLELLAGRGIQTKVEAPYGKVFPTSDRASDVVAALEAELRDRGVEVRCHAPVCRIRVNAGTPGGSPGGAMALRSRVIGVELEGREVVGAAAVVVATGGRSCPRSGSTGDGYAMAAEVGHRVEPVWPSLVPLRVAGTRALSGVALRGIAGTAIVGGKLAGPRFEGDALFTHFGLSGPLVLQLSRAAASGLHRGLPVELRFDLLPLVPAEAVDRLIQDRCGAASRSLVSKILADFLPRSAAEVFLQSAGLSPERRCADVTRQERTALARALKSWSFAIEGWHSFDGAEVTAGGVAVAEIDPRTFASRKVDGLYFAGEVIDVDGYVGGYNLQAAWSTGWVAGRAAATQPGPV